jgi:hypothetical protein
MDCPEPAWFGCGICHYFSSPDQAIFRDDKRNRDNMNEEDDKNLYCHDICIYECKRDIKQNQVSLAGRARLPSTKARWSSFLFLILSLYLMNAFLRSITFSKWSLSTLIFVTFSPLSFASSAASWVARAMAICSASLSVSLAESG